MREGASAVAAYRSMASDLGYVSMAVTWGKAGFLSLERRGVRSLQELSRREREQVRAEVKEVNKASYLPKARAVGKLARHPLVIPALFDAELSQEGFLDVYKELFTEKVAEVFFLDDWEYQRGSLVELVHGVEMQAGIVRPKLRPFRDAQQVRLYDERGKALAVDTMCEKLALAVGDLQSRGFDAGTYERQLIRLEWLAQYMDEHNTVLTHYPALGEPFCYGRVRAAVSSLKAA